MNAKTDSTNLPQSHGNRNNRIRELRLLVELLSLTTIFLFLSIILFSITSDTFSILKNTCIELSFNIKNFHFFYWVLGAFSAFMALISLILMFWRSKANCIEDLIENSKKHIISFRIFWIILWCAIVVTFIAGLVDTSNRLTEPLYRAITLFGGTAIFLIAAVKIITVGFRRK